MSLKKGDKVVMTNCGEAEHYAGKIWTCAGDQFKSNKGPNAEDVVFLEGFSGFFICRCLTKQALTTEDKRKAESKVFKEELRKIRGM